MKQHLNTLYVTTQGAYLGKDGDAVDVRVEHESKLRVPMVNLDGIVCFGQVSLSPALMALCAESDVSVTFLTENGRFLARVLGFSPGNVLLRREQYRSSDDAARCRDVARNIVAGKLANARTTLLRALRDHPNAAGAAELEDAAARLARGAAQAKLAETTDQVRGIEGEGAANYFSVFNHLMTVQRDEFAFRARSRRPPLDPINAVLSFVYTLLTHDARAAAESCGLDAAVGFLHRDRPGRPGLALDLIEELRSYLADRLVLSLINRQQIRAEGFSTTESGGVVMDDRTRRTVLGAYQERKRETITHPFLDEKITLGILFHIQARLLARHLRGDLDAYPPFIWR